MHMGDLAFGLLFGFVSFILSHCLLPELQALKKGNAVNEEALLLSSCDV